MATNEQGIRLVTLPFFNRVVRQFGDTFSHRLQEKARSEGVLSTISAYVIHEGDSSAIVRSPDEVESTEMHEASAEIELSKDRVEKFSLSDALSAIDRLAEQFRRQHTQTLFSTLEKVTAKTGNVVNGRGKKLDHEAVFEVFSKISHDFTDGPRKSDLMMIVSPDLEGRLAELQREFDASPELQEQFNRIMAEKYEQYRSREMDRNLAG